jgi:hypothetical protein
MNEQKVVDDYYFFTDREGHSRLYGTIIADDRYDPKSHDFAPGQHVITSRVRRIKSKNGVTYAYTENSVYKLLHPRKGRHDYCKEY